MHTQGFWALAWPWDGILRDMMVFGTGRALDRFLHLASLGLWLCHHMLVMVEL